MLLDEYKDNSDGRCKHCYSVTGGCIECDYAPGPGALTCKACLSGYYMTDTNST